MGNILNQKNIQTQYRECKKEQNKEFSTLSYVNRQHPQSNRIKNIKRKKLKIELKQNQAPDISINGPSNGTHQKNNQSCDSTPIRKIQMLQFEEQSQKKGGLVDIPIKKYYYQGQINEFGKFQGNGILFYPGGKKRYSGSFKQGLFNGFGILQNYQPYYNEGYQVNYRNLSHNISNVWTHYEGQFLLGKIHGFGTLYYSTGDKFSGCFNQQMAEGFGTFYKKSGSVINGVWSHNNLNQ